MSLPAELSAALPAVQAAAAATGSDYKALVNVYFVGGNDCHNTVIPTAGPAYSAYAATRDYLALPNDGTAALTGQSAKLHPQLAGIANLFNAGKCAILANVGTLTKPLTKAQFEANDDRPLVLFSHSDQQRQWQSGLPDSPSAQTGWGGRMMDLVNPSFNPNASTEATVSIAGDNVFMRGYETIQYAVAAGYASELGLPFGGTEGEFFKQFTQTTEGTNLLENALAAVAVRGNATGFRINSAIENIDPQGFPDTSLAQQLKMVARMIAARSTFGHRRDVFYVQIAGFDTHAGQLPIHDGLMQEVNGALVAFFNSLSTLGTGGTSLQNAVTMFTGSDFGRCLVPNSGGSDHGWGGHHLIIGGAVKGGQIYRKENATDTAITKGSMCNIQLNGKNDAGQGRLLPTTSVDEYSATLLKWFGIPSSALNAMIPNLSRFTLSDLGFMAP